MLALDASFNRTSQSLTLPQFTADATIVHPVDFAALYDLRWFKHLIPTFNCYCSFFKESTILGACSQTAPLCSLVRSRPLKLTSGTAADNVLHNVSRAFNSTGVFQNIYDHRSYEFELPINYQLMARFSIMNLRFDHRLLADFHFNVDGPNWQQNLSIIDLNYDNAYSAIQSCVVNDYYSPTGKPSN